MSSLNQVWMAARAAFIYSLLAVFMLASVSPAHAAAAQPQQQAYTGSAYTGSMDIQAEASKIYRIAIEEYRSAGFNIEPAPPVMTVLRVRKDIAESGYFLIELHARTNLWTVVRLSYEVRRGWVFWKRRTLEQPVNIQDYLTVLERVKKRSEREP